MGRLADEEVGGVVSVDRLPCFIMCFRRVFSHDNREEARLEINKGKLLRLKNTIAIIASKILQKLRLQFLWDTIKLSLFLN